MPPEIDAKTRSYEDIGDDVASAYTELMERAAADTVAPRGAELSDDEPRREIREPADSSPARDNSGRFLPKESEAPKPPIDEKALLTKDTEAKSQEPNAQEKPPQEPPVVALNEGPPPNWSIRSKSAWDALPPDVKQDVIRRESEMREGLAALRDYQNLKPYAEMAKQHNTTIDKALQHYVGMENLLRTDIAAGFDRIAKNTGMSQAQLASVFSGLAQRYGAQNVQAAMQPGAQQQPGDPLQEALKPYLQPLQEKLTHYEQTIRQQQERQRAEAASGLEKAIEVFKADPTNRYYPDLEQAMTKLFETGMVPLTGNHAADLKAAYELAAYQNADIREALIEKRLSETREKERKAEAEKVAKAKSASKSVGGGRTPGTVIQAAKPGSSTGDDIEDDVRAAFMALSQR